MAASTFARLLQALLLAGALASTSSSNGVQALYQGGLIAQTTAASAGHAGHEAAAKAGGYRKSLGFGPLHPAQLVPANDALYTTFAAASVQNSVGVSSSSTGRTAAQDLLHKVNGELKQMSFAAGNKQGQLDAHAFVASKKLIEALTPTSLADGDEITWRIRQDSYTDSVSGISHVYARATLRGLEIANADLNINVSPQGQILSFGNSLYTAQQGKSVSFAPGATMSISSASFTQRLGREHGLLADASAKLVDPRLALVHFLAEASPFASFAQDLNEHAEHYADSMRLDVVRERDEGLASALSFFDDAHTSISSEQVPVYTISHVPLAVKPAKATLAFLQVPSKNAGMDLELVWKVEVEMRDNYYEAYLTASPESRHVASDKEDEEAKVRTLAVADWVQSMPTSRQRQEQIPMLTAPHWDVSPETAKLAAQAAAADAESEETGLWHWEQVTPEDKKQKEGEGEQTEFPADPQLKVFKWGYNDPTDGIRSIENGVRPHSPASPLGWHRVPASSDPFADEYDHDVISQGGVPVRKKVGKYVEYKDTRGNNVIASPDPAGMGDWKNAKRPVASHTKGAYKEGKDEEGHGSWIFDFPFPWRKYDANHTALDPASYSDAATTQLFYTTNKYHDFLWGYGFDEVSGNFQADNFGRGGKGGDALIALSQDGAGQNNADFSTPPDGSKPRMRMYTWSGTPQRDGDFEEGIVIHEYSHGLSTRLTGGPANSGCLAWGEAGGYGEGAGDSFATIIRRKNATVQDWTMGEWASHMKGGIRKYPYSTNMTVDVETYETLDKPGYWGVHAIGEVFAGMANELTERMIAKHGFVENVFIPLPNATQEEQDAFFLTPSEIERSGKADKVSKRRIPRHGNTLTLQLLVDGMKLQPCRPGFHDIRDGIIQADENLTGGNNTCTIWGAFAKRGLGTDSKVEFQTPWGGGVRTNGFKVPAKCKSDDTKE